MYDAKEDRVKTDNIGKGNKSKELEKENDIKEVSFKNSYKMTPILIGSLCGRPSGKGEILKYEILAFGTFTLHMR